MSNPLAFLLKFSPASLAELLTAAMTGSAALIYI
jgi:hypothetical protein